MTRVERQLTDMKGLLRRRCARTLATLVQTSAHSRFKPDKIREDIVGLETMLGRFAEEKGDAAKPDDEFCKQWAEEQWKTLLKELNKKFLNSASSSSGEQVRTSQSAKRRREAEHHENLEYAGKLGLHVTATNDSDILVGRGYVPLDAFNGSLHVTVKYLLQIAESVNPTASSSSQVLQVDIPPNCPDAVAPMAFCPDDSEDLVAPEYLQLWLSGAVTVDWVVERAGMSTLQWYLTVRRNGGDNMLPGNSHVQGMGGGSCTPVEPARGDMEMEEEAASNEGGPSASM